MKRLPLTDDLRTLSRRVIWFEQPEQALSDTPRFVAYAMTYGRHEDMKILRCYPSDAELIEALENAPPGIFDGRSWAYWNLKLGRFPTPKLPERQLT